MTRITVLSALAVGLLGNTSSMPAATIVTTPTVAVGTCRPGFPTYTTISAAVGAATAGTKVLICPGTYTEQVHVTQSLTLQGVNNGNADQAIIAPPGSGLANNATDDFGGPLAVQLWVDNAPGGPVNISNIAVDATGHQVTSCTPEIVGIFYQNSAGTVNQVDIRNQKGSRCGVGFWAEGGSALPSVTFANSNVHDVDFTGINTETNATTSELNATIKGNYVNVVPGSSIGVFGVLIRQGSTGTVSGNVITSGDSGIIVTSGSTGSVSGNTVINTQTGINADSDGASVTNNKVFNSAVGIEISTSVAAIQNNIISNSTTGMEFFCFADTNATHNIINEAQTGIRDVPASLSIPNTYSNVGAIRTGC